jgi:hypothetical protein
MPEVMELEVGVPEAALDMISIKDAANSLTLSNCCSVAASGFHQPRHAGAFTALRPRAAKADCTARLRDQTAALEVVAKPRFCVILSCLRETPP